MAVPAGLEKIAQVFVGVGFQAFPRQHLLGLLYGRLGVRKPSVQALAGLETAAVPVHFVLELLEAVFLELQGSLCGLVALFNGFLGLIQWDLGELLFGTGHDLFSLL